MRTNELVIVLCNRCLYARKYADTRDRERFPYYEETNFPEAFDCV
jgi:hypothetical protein